MTHDCCFCDAKFRSFPLLASHLYDQHKVMQSGDRSHNLTMWFPSGDAGAVYYCWCGNRLTKDHIKEEGGLVQHVLSIGFFQPELPF